MPKSLRKFYDETFKLEVLRDYYQGGLSISATSRKWKLASMATLVSWIRLHPFDSESLSLPAELLAKLKMAKEAKSKETLLEEEVLRLKKSLELEKLRSTAFKRLIELTEKEEGISILKKGGVKQ